MIDLEDVLNGSPTISELGEFFAKGEFHSDRNLHKAIRKHLLTEDEKDDLSRLGISLSDALAYEIEPKDENFVHNMFANWNKKLGTKAFY